MRDSDRPRGRPVRRPHERDFSQRDEDDDREPPARRSRGGNGPLILLVLLGGGCFAVLVIGAFAFFSYRAATKARQEQIRAMEDERAFDMERGLEAPAAPKAIPDLPPPPAGPTASLPTVTLSNLRREKGLGGRDEILVDYEFSSGFPLASRDALIVKSSTGETRVSATGTQRSGTIRYRPLGPQAAAGSIEVWWERRSGVGPRANPAKVSNSLTLD